MIVFRPNVIIKTRYKGWVMSRFQNSNSFAQYIFCWLIGKHKISWDSKFIWIIVSCTNKPIRPHQPPHAIIYLILNQPPSHIYTMIKKKKANTAALSCMGNLILYQQFTLPLLTFHNSWSFLLCWDDYGPWEKNHKNNTSKAKSS